MKTTEYARKVHSQFGEDGITLELCRRLQPMSRRFLEIGAGHNGENNTRALLDEGWEGIWVDAMGDQLASFKTPKLEIVTAFLTLENMDEVLAPWRHWPFGVLSLDVDGNDYWFFNKLGRMFRPWVFIVECNTQVPMDKPYIAPYRPDYVWNHSDRDIGASRCSMIDLARKLDYWYVGMASETPHLDSPNAYFVRRDFMDRLQNVEDGTRR